MTDAEGTTGTETATSFFDARAEHYDQSFDAPGADGYSLRARLQTTTGLLGSGPGHVLDAGMGPGRLCTELERLGWTVSGIDESHEMVALARRRLPTASPRLLQAGIEELPFPDDSFDAVAATGVLEYADPRAALAELARVLRPGGRAVVSYPNPHAFYGLWKGHVYYPLVRVAKLALGRGGFGLPHTSNRIPPDQVEAFVSASGLSPRAATFTSFLLVPSPFDQLLPTPSEQLGQWAAERGHRFERRMATQVVYLAEKESER